MSKGTFWPTRFFWKKKLSVPFRTLNEKLSSFWQKIFGRVVKQILRVQKNILTKIAFVKKEDLCFIFGNWAEKFWGLWRKKSRVDKTAIFMSKEHFEKNRLKERIIDFIIVRAPTAAMIQIFREKKKETVVITTLSASSWPFGGKIYFLREVFFSNQFRFLSKEFGLFVTNSRDGCKNCFLCSLGTFSWGKLNFGNFPSFFNHFRILNWQFSEFWRKKLGRVAKFVFDEPRGSFWRKKGFWKQNKKKILSFWTLSEKRWDVGKKFLIAFYKLHITWPKELFWIFPNFWWLILSNWDFRKKMEALSKLLFMSPEDSFERKKTYRKLCFLPSFLDMAQNHYTSGKKNQGGLPKLHSQCPKDLFEEEQFFWEFIITFSRFELKTIEVLWRLSVAQSKRDLCAQRKVLRNRSMNFSNNVGFMQNFAVISAKSSIKVVKPKVYVSSGTV